MNGKTVVVTGGGRGIGRAICQRFASAGANVVAAARTEAELSETAKLITSSGGVCETVRADVGVAADVEAMVSSAVKRFGGIDVLVNNAGVALCGPVDEMDLDAFDRMNRVNMNAVVYTCRSVWDLMRRKGEGVIVNLSSMAAVDPFPGFAAYGATKSYVEALTRSLAKEGGEHGIRVYAVGPGAVDTQMLRGPFPDFPDEQCLKPNDIAEMVYQVTQPPYRHSTGQTIYVTK
jgi:NAD(P)-dependent dehydrogenase (short-subunit alcohol dehydrogenase family)